jgi:tetratricopeptide (TPR) repeat protein
MVTSDKLILGVLVIALLGACSNTTQSARTVTSASQSLEQLYQEGRLAYAAERYAEAAGIFARVVRSDPQHLNALINWGAALSRSGKPIEAIPKYQQALAQDANNAEAYYNWGVALERIGNHQEALSKYDRAVALKAEILTPGLQNYLQRHRHKQQETQIKSTQPKPTGAPR